MPRTLTTTLMLASLIVTPIQLMSKEAFSPYPSTWVEIKPPPASACVAHEAWSYAANYSPRTWRVRNEGPQVRAALAKEPILNEGPRPDFASPTGRFRNLDAFLRVPDGWLAGNNMGEFGANLYWFSADGKRSYEISKHQVVDFIQRKGRIYAIEGLAHLGMSRGSLIEIEPSKTKNGQMRWIAKQAVILPQAPSAAVSLPDGTLLIALSGSLVSVAPDMTLKTLLADAPWNMFYANSAALNGDGSKLYLGMREYVGEFDLHTRNLRLLVPNADMQNKLDDRSVQSLVKQCRNTER